MSATPLVSARHNATGKGAEPAARPRSTVTTMSTSSKATSFRPARPQLTLAHRMSDGRHDVRGDRGVAWL
jgi:hypothetical protein